MLSVYFTVVAAFRVFQELTFMRLARLERLMCNGFKDVGDTHGGVFT